MHLWQESKKNITPHFWRGPFFRCQLSFKFCPEILDNALLTVSKKEITVSNSVKSVLTQNERGSQINQEILNTSPLFSNAMLSYRMEN